MNRILTDFYYGRISPWERRPIQSAEGREINRKIEDEKRYLIQKMSLDDCRRFQVKENLYLQSSDLEQFGTFSCGFKLGTELMIAVLVDRQ